VLVVVVVVVGRPRAIQRCRSHLMGVTRSLTGDRALASRGLLFVFGNFATGFISGGG
jgi:hypothetical protein